jgi:hypothetical protein
MIVHNLPSVEPILNTHPLKKYCVSKKLFGLHSHLFVLAAKKMKIMIRRCDKFNVKQIALF